MKIGLLTFHHVLNEGAALQAYSLSKKMREIFSEDKVEVIDYRPLATEIRDFFYVLGGIKKPHLFAHRLRRYLNFRKFIRSRLPLSKDQLISDRYDHAMNFLKSKYDVVIVGSDEVWKKDNSRFSRPFPNIYWLPAPLGFKKFAFAASANKMDYQTLTGDQRAWMKLCLDTFTLIGVRDRHTQAMIESIGAYDASRVRRVPDPTFMLEETTPVSDRLRGYGIDLTRPILLITFHDKQCLGPLIGHFKSKGFQTVALTAYSPSAEFNLADKFSPLEWASVYGHATLCLTNLFHGTIFCIKNAVPFLSFDYYKRADRDTKIHDLLEEFQLTARFVEVNARDFDPVSLIVKAETAVQKKADRSHMLGRCKRDGEGFLELIKAKVHAGRKAAI